MTTPIAQGPVDVNVRGDLCDICGRPPHVCDDPECVPANAPIAEQLTFVIAENARLRALVAELTDAFTVIWVSDDRAAWDGKAVEHFDALLVKVVGSDTATPNAKVTGAAPEKG